jgi:hypothetical protein
MNRGTVHGYLGMTIDFSEKGKGKFIMNDYVENLLDEVPKEMSGHAATPAANQLFTVKDKAEKISDEDSEKYHRLTAKLLYLSKRARLDLQTAVAFLCKWLNNQTLMIGRSSDDAYVICREPRNLSSRWKLVGLACYNGELMHHLQYIRT